MPNENYSKEPEKYSGKWTGTRTPKPADFVPEELFPAGHTMAGWPRCLAWSNNQGHQCGKRPIRGLGILRLQTG
jgi:hypothetical protein